MNWLASFVQDVRYGLRQLRESPGFALVAVMSLALGIGANTAIFQLVDAVRLRTLPVEKPWELLSIDLAPGSERSGWYSTRSCGAHLRAMGTDPGTAAVLYWRAGMERGAV